MFNIFAAGWKLNILQKEGDEYQQPKNSNFKTKRNEKKRKQNKTKESKGLFSYFYKKKRKFKYKGQSACLYAMSPFIIINAFKVLYTTNMSSKGERLFDFNLKGKCSGQMHFNCNLRNLKRTNNKI